MYKLDQLMQYKSYFFNALCNAILFYTADVKLMFDSTPWKC